MGIGKRKQVRIIPYTSAKNASGSFVETPGTGVNIWAKVENPSGSRGYQNGQTQMSNTRTFMVRFKFDLFPDANWRLMYDGKLWTVTDIQKVDERKFYYLISATSKDV